MHFRSKHDLERYLAREIHNRILPRKPPGKAKAKRGPERNEDYKAWIRTLPCCACESYQDVEAAHTGKDGGKGQKPSDYSCVPLCAACHRTGPRAYHGLNSSAPAFAAKYRLDFARLAARLRAEWRAGRNAA